MPENTQYFIYAILAAAVILIVLMIIALALLFTFSKYFANRKFRVKASFDVNPDTKEDGFTLTVYNNNLNDVRINDFGLIYNGERITYTERYRTSHGCAPSENPIILAHGLIWLDLPVKELEELLKLRNKGSLKLKKLAIFVDDSLGIQSYRRGDQKGFQSREKRTRSSPPPRTKESPSGKKESVVYQRQNEARFPV